MSSWARRMELKNFAAHAAAVERGIKVCLTGTAGLGTKSKLDRFLRDIHSEAERSLAKEVMVDVRDLQFLNSSCLKCFVSWVTTVQEQPGNNQYRIVFLSCPAIDWQRRGLNALACLANEIISIQA